ncbi:hypothetical protein G6F24_013748 [Rhizopus arrhizus]|nr:hypothetical protein G6F24_013748 [Rhizopus arrhizus]
MLRIPALPFGAARAVVSALGERPGCRERHMAFSSAGRSGPLAEINVTPLVDVMLVLLIIFIVTAPIVARPIAVQLPQATDRTIDRPEPPPPIELRLDASNQLSWDGQPMAISDLQARLQAQVVGHVARQRELATIGGAIAQIERNLPERAIAGLQLAVDQVGRQLQAAGHRRAGNARLLRIGIHAQALAACINVQLGMQDLQLGQPGRLVAVVAWIAEARGQVHVAQQLHTVEAGVRFTERDLRIEQFGRAAA